MKSALAVINGYGKIIVDAGSVINEDTIILLTEEQFPGLYICDDTMADIAYPFLVSLDTKIELIKLINNINHEFTLECEKLLLEKYLPLLIEELTENNEIEVVPPEIRPLNNFDVFHKLNIFILSILTGIKLGISDYEIKQLALYILTPTFPKNVEFENADLYYIVEMIRDFDLMVSGRDFNNNISTFKALNNIISAADNKYGRDWTELFLKVIAPYPLGTRVRLNTGEIGVIMDINKSSIYKPIVRVVGDTPRGIVEIDLMKHNNYVIIEVVL